MGLLTNAKPEENADPLVQYNQNQIDIILL